MSEQTKFKVGQVWEDRRGALNKILAVTEYALSVKDCSTTYEPFYYTIDGNYDPSGRSHFDLVKLVYDPKNGVSDCSISQKITQIEQQLQELKELLKD